MSDEPDKLHRVASSYNNGVTSGTLAEFAAMLLAHRDGKIAERCAEIVRKYGRENVLRSLADVGLGADALEEAPTRGRKK